MKRILLVVPFCICAAGALAQDEGSAASSGEPNLLNEAWAMDDAVPLATGQVDLRFSFGWVTADFPANRGDSDDDFFFTPSLVWGTCDNVEAFVSVPIWLGDGGDVGANDRGNADTFAGFLWRFAEPQDAWPAMAVQVTARIPTGDNSGGVDGEFRLILTNDYDSGLRSHVNVFASTVNGNNEPSLEHFQYGVVLGMDGPLCSNGAVRWVADYMHRSRFREGAANINLFEIGWEWEMAEAQRLGMSVQVGLDDNEDTPNFGAIITYSHSLTF